MNNLVPVASFDDVPQIEVDMLLLGGAGGPMNASPQALLNRTEFLNINKADSEDLASPDGVLLVGNSVDKRALAEPSGADMVGWVQLGAGSIPRSVQDKMREWVSPEDFFLASESDWTGAVRRAIRYCEDNRKELRWIGVYRVSDELFVRKQIKITGCGSGSGYGELALTGYQQISGLLVTGTGTRRIRTRQRWRGTALDPQDAPLSVALNIQAENCVFRDFTVFLDFDRTDASPRNYGADWDCGIFVGTRVHQTFENVHVAGYWREAGFWFDVTRQTSLPQFLDPDGVPFEAGTVQNGGDGCTMYKCFARGAKWGARVAGSQPKPGADLFTDPYYDELLGATASDARGSFGFSDFTMTACSIYSTDHHSNRRRDDPTGDYLTDTAGGAIWISGMNGSGRIQGMRLISSRFATFEPYRVRLGRCNRVLLIGSHIETRSGSSRRTTTGDPILFTAADTYGQISMEAQTRNVLVQGASGAITANGFGAFIDPAATYHEIFSGTSGNVSSTFHTWLAAGYRAMTGELDLRAETNLNDVRLRGGSDTYATVGANGFQFGSGTGSSAVIAYSGMLDLRAADGSYVSLRSGNVTTANIDNVSARFVPPVTAPSFRGRTNDLNLEAVANTDAINFKGGADTIATLTAGTMAFPGAAVTLSTPVGIFDIRSGAGQYVNLRSGSTTVAQIGPVTALFSATTTIRSSSNGVVSLGASGNRFLDTFTVNTRLGDGSTIETAGVGSPEGVVTATVGSRFWRTDGAAGSRLYWKATGAGNTGWAGIL